MRLERRSTFVTRRRAYEAIPLKLKPPPNQDKASYHVDLTRQRIIAYFRLVSSVHSAESSVRFPKVTSELND